MDNLNQTRYDDVSTFDHMYAEGYGDEMKRVYAEKLISDYHEEFAGLQSKISEAGYSRIEDVILLSDPCFHEHELIHRLGERIRGKEPKETQVSINGERIIDEELAEVYGMTASDTEAYVVDDYSKEYGNLLCDYLDRLVNISVEEDDIILDLDTDELPNQDNGQKKLEEMVAQYLTDGKTMDSLNMFLAYNISPRTYKKTSRALEKLDKDSNYQRGMMARRALVYDSAGYFLDNMEEIEDVGLFERGNLNGELKDESLFRLIIREFRNRF